MKCMAPVEASSAGPCRVGEVYDGSKDALHQRKGAAGGHKRQAKYGAVPGDQDGPSLAQGLAV